MLLLDVYGQPGGCPTLGHRLAVPRPDPDCGKLEGAEDVGIWTATSFGDAVPG
jgi:hypothetical protein